MMVGTDCKSALLGVLPIIEKMEKNRILLLVITLIFFSCEKEKSINAKVYKEGAVIGNYDGTFYSTKSGGLSYYIKNEDERSQLFNLSKIDSIIFLINEKKYSAKPIVRMAYSRERNNSDFSFSVNSESYKIIVDEVNQMNTITIFSEKTDMEELKDKKLIDFSFVND